MTLSRTKAEQVKVWSDIEEAYNDAVPIEGLIVGKVKGGLKVDIGVSAFLPGSHADLRPTRNLDRFIGQKGRFAILKFNRSRGNVVVSRRAVLEKERSALKEETLRVLEEGIILEGSVKNITDYGAFVDLGGIDGLLHITDMSWGRISHPSEVINVGDQLKVVVLKYDAERERVSLGMKQILPDPWTTAEERYPTGKRINGKVVSITDYGAFVELEKGVEGLIHVSEMSWDQACDPSVEAPGRGRRGRGAGSRRRSDQSPDLVGPETGRAESVGDGARKPSDRQPDQGRGQEHHRLRHLRRRRGWHRRPSTHLGPPLDQKVSTLRSSTRRATRSRRWCSGSMSTTSGSPLA